MVQLVTWGVFLLGFAKLVSAEETITALEPSCEAPLWNVPDDETLPCNVGSACRDKYRAANGSELDMWPEESWRVRIDRFHTETYRLKLNKHQPSLVPKYTEVGYKVERLDQRTYDYLINWYKKALMHDAPVKETWSADNVYFNHWKCDTHMVYSTGGVQKRLFRDLQPLMEQWSGLALKPSAVYGVRIYPRGSVLANHVDRVDTHVISAIINVAQTNVDTEWPLYVKGHDGVAREILMKSGEIVYYESASVIHGRPTPFDGEEYANIFVHFAPLKGWTLTPAEVDRFFQEKERRPREDSSI